MAPHQKRTDRPAAMQAEGMNVTTQADDVRQQDRLGTEEVILGMAKTKPAGLTDDLRLVDDLGYDSLRLIELAIAVEQHLGLPRIDLERVITIATVGDVVAMVEQVREEVRT